jgi:hypothetical protein
MSWERAARGAVLVLYAPLVVSLVLGVFISGMAMRQNPAAGVLGLGQLALLYAAWRRVCTLWAGAATRLWVDAVVAGAFIASVLRWGRH